MIENLDQSSVAGTVAAVITGAASFVFFLRRKFSNDNVEIAKDRAEESIITHLENQRDFAIAERNAALDKLKLAEEERNDALMKVNNLTHEVEHLSGQVKILRELVERLGITLDETTKRLDFYIVENTKLVARLEKDDEGHG